jgi:fucose permease
MSVDTAALATDRHSGYRKNRLFFVSALALATAGINASLRANTAADLQRIFLDPIDAIHSATMIASILGVPFLGFALTIAIGSPLLDYIGMKVLLPLAGLAFTVGMTLIMFADHLASGTGIYQVIYLGALTAGIGWGLVETVVNPLVATLYPEDKTARLNVVHAWWPGGLVIGGLLGVGMSKMGLGELKSPLFFVLFFSMFLTAASELAPGQWVDIALSRTVHMPGILLLVYVSGLMFVMRHFAGALGKLLSPIGVLWLSSLLAALGLLALSYATSPVTGLLAATVWGTGVCFMWPTMLASASERFPRGGALLMGLMGTAGTLSIQFVLPFMGQVFDRKKIAAAGGAEAFQKLTPGPELDRVLGLAAQVSFRAVALLPALLLFVFAGIWLYDRSKGGFRRQSIAQEPAEFSL